LDEEQKQRHRLELVRNAWIRPKHDTLLMVADEGRVKLMDNYVLKRASDVILSLPEDSDDAVEKTTTQNDDREKEDLSPEMKPKPRPDIMSVAMIATLGFYKNFISPLLPPACRFVPTCSRYGVLAIQEFGPTKGVILIAWRLLRCSPIGGKGYDPPRWPPVPFNYSSY
jgi:hypothetical protein